MTSLGVRCMRGTALAGALGPRPFLLSSSRSFKKKILDEGGIIYKGDLPGMPRNTSANLTIPGESEEPNTEVGGFSWMGYERPSLTPEYEEGKWNPDSKRVGAIGRKMGMMNVWDARGAKTMCTVIQVDQCQVTKVVRFLSGRGTPRVNLQLGAIPANPKSLRKSQLCAFRKMGVAPKRRLAEFEVSQDAILPPGTTISVRHFVPGQYVDVRGVSRNHGFTGGMKRWGFKGGNASHGTSLAHRAIGSTGMCQSPGRVFPGKKMAGHKGGNNVKFLNMLIYKMDVKRNLLFIRGSIPGRVGQSITLADAERKKWSSQLPPPFPTYEQQPGDDEIDELVMDVAHLDHQFV